MNCIKSYVKKVIKKYMTNPAKLIESKFETFVSNSQQYVASWSGQRYRECLLWSADAFQPAMLAMLFKLMELWTQNCTLSQDWQKNQGENVDMYQITQEPDWKPVETGLYTVKCLQWNTVEAVQNKRDRTRSLENYSWRQQRFPKNVNGLILSIFLLPMQMGIEPPTSS